MREVPIRHLVLRVVFYMLCCKIYKISKTISYCDFVLGKKNSISTELPVVISSQGSQNDLKSGGRSVEVGSQLVSLHLVVSSDNTEHDRKGRSSFIAKEFVLWDQSRLIRISTSPIPSVKRPEDYEDDQDSPFCRWPQSLRHCFGSWKLLLRWLER